MAEYLRRDFDDFLFASVTMDTSGNLLTVVTVLARLDLDPWEEAASLARMSPDAAAQRLASHLARVPNGPATQDERLAVATRLAALLLRRAPAPITRARSRGRDPAPAVVIATQVKRANPAIYLLIALILMLLGQWIAAVREPQFPANSSQPSVPGDG
jgi:hypothetical protein